MTKNDRDNCIDCEEFRKPSTEKPMIPIIDIAAFTAGPTLSSTPSHRRATASRLRLALSQNGSVGISGHGLPKELLDEAFRISKALFDLPYDTKMLAPHPDAAVPHRGYSGIGRENASAKTALEVEGDVAKEEMVDTKDYKESYEIGHPDNKIQYNIWLPEDALPGFQKFMLSFHNGLNLLASQIYEALVASLELPETEADAARSLFSPQESQLRLLHYPPVKQGDSANGITSRLGAHRDWSIFTLLFQDENGGLEFHDRDTDQFLPATPKDGVLYLNIGDMFQRLSNGVYPSALHRVVQPGEAANQPSKARYSIPFFVGPSPEAMVSPQPSLVAACGKQVYEPITFNDYCTMMFNTTNVYG